MPERRLQKTRDAYAAPTTTTSYAERAESMYRQVKERRKAAGLVEPIQPCPKCGNALFSTSSYCSRCGSVLGLHRDTGYLVVLSESLGR